MVNVIIACARPWLAGNVIDSIHYGEPHNIPLTVQVVLTCPTEEPWCADRVNVAMQNVNDGWIYQLPDDTLVHQSFFRRFEELVKEYPNAECFVVNQERRDGIGEGGILKARHENMKPFSVDSSQLIFKRSFLGTHHYQNLQLCDGVLAKTLYAKDPSKIVYVDETLAYFEAQWWFRNGVMHHDRYK